ncbi:MAG: hypothetical protein KJ676_02670 [Alphaproteobacteria bacterium]|nr:hypothetical protein [Alphaproteobacteria bacterium]MBU1526561.1 hypothetical protein [Alphaproteobacteria bacterium]MBU2116128.1 hypothetical protein [Alphaproteobacteria bacterium]MBU2351530.1 hypothetical protein [Alphaproteobacteria bacterium]MBU2381345.1 hypothetical protein [Alphaproteobacteria bacterium]
MKALIALVPAAVLALSACATAPAQSPQDAFFAHLTDLCGQTFQGRVAADDTNDPGFAGKTLVMHVRDCSATEIRIPFHVGEDHSRTWVITRTGAGLRLKHDHRHADGTPDVLTWYGGHTATPGTAERQEFPVDAESIALFTREGRTVSNTNVWAIELRPGREYVYELARPGGRLFRVAFDLSRPVSNP